MATFDPNISVRLQSGGGPSTGGPPQLISPPAAGSAAGHIASAFATKRDANAHNRGLDMAAAHLSQIMPALQSYKLQHLADDDFDTNYTAKFDEEWEKVKKDYAPNNEAEHEAYNTRITNAKTQDTLHAFVEGMKAHHENQLAVTNRVLGDLQAAYASTPGSSDAEKVQSEAFLALHKASLQSGRYPGVVTPQQAVVQFDTWVRQAEVSRIMAHMDPKTLFEMGHDPQSAIQVGAVDIDTMKSGNFTGQTKVLSLTQGERDGMITYAINKFKRETDILEHERKLHGERAAYNKTVIERKFIDTVISDPSKGTEALAQLQAMTTEDGRPMFDASEIAKWATDIHTRTTAADKPRQTSDPDAVSSLSERIYRKNPDGGLDYSSYPLPDVSEIYGNPLLSQAHKDHFANAIQREREIRTNRDFSDYARRRTEAHNVLESAFGGKGLIDLNPAMRTFFGEVENAFFARLNQKYQDAVDAGNGLKSIQPQQIVNQILFEKGPAFHSVVFPQVKAQTKTLYRYVAAVPADVPDDANPYVYVSAQILKDMNEPGRMPNRAGRLPNEEGIRLLQLLQAASAGGVKMGELRELMLQPFSFSMPGVPDLTQIGGDSPQLTKPKPGPKVDKGLGFWERLFPQKYGQKESQ